MRYNNKIVSAVLMTLFYYYIACLCYVTYTDIIELHTNHIKPKHRLLYDYGGHRKNDKQLD